MSVDEMVRLSAMLTKRRGLAKIRLTGGLVALLTMLINLK